MLTAGVELVSLVHYDGDHVSSMMVKVKVLHTKSVFHKVEEWDGLCLLHGDNGEVGWSFRLHHSRYHWLDALNNQAVGSDK